MKDLTKILRELERLKLHGCMDVWHNHLIPDATKVTFSYKLRRAEPNQLKIVLDINLRYINLRKREPEEQLALNGINLDGTFFTPEEVKPVIEAYDKLTKYVKAHITKTRKYYRENNIPHGETDL